MPIDPTKLSALGIKGNLTAPTGTAALIRAAQLNQPGKAPSVPIPAGKSVGKKFSIGQTLGKLTLLRRKHDKRQKSPNRRKQWEVKCECKPDVKFWVPEYYLRRAGNPKRDCGCSRRSIVMKHNKEYRIWYMMNTRTSNPDHVAFKHYGGRGIKVCDRWKWGAKGGILEKQPDGTDKQVKTGFECFMEDMGPRPNPNMSIDRQNNDVGYQPGNVVWATDKQQGNNRRSKEQIARDLKEYERRKKAGEFDNYGKEIPEDEAADLDGEEDEDGSSEATLSDLREDDDLVDAADEDEDT